MEQEDQRADARARVTGCAMSRQASAAGVDNLGMHPRRLLALVLVMGCAGLFAAASPATAAPPPQRAPTLFVLRGPTRGGRELSVSTRRVEWFTDRPERRAGTMTPQALVRGWQAWGFDHDAPNAALTGKHLDVVVELSKPRVRGDRLHFDVAPVRGRLPRGNLGAVSTFVDATTAASTSTVQIVNNSGQQTTAYVFVTTPNPQVQSTAWLAEQVFPGENNSLTWDTSTQLMWAYSALEPGSTFEAQQVLSVPPAGPGQTGAVDLAQENGSYIMTSDQTSAVAPPGSLAVLSSPSVSVGSVSVAMGLSGAPALVAQAMPDFVNTFPTNGLTYWLSTSPFVQPGQVLPNYATYNAVQLDFPPGVGALTATLNADGTWTIQPS
jgi:rhizosphere induced protein